ncbi:MAG: hypothetical protein ACLQQB_13765 [Solirubrobacteraceae bacterium]
MTSSPSSSLAGLLLLASRIVCLIVLAAFVVFVVNQTSTASTHQQNEVLEGSSSAQSTSKPKPESTVHRTLDEAAEALTSPFAGAVSGSHSQWTIQIVRTALALLVYGLGVAFLVRFIRVRV